MKNQDTKLTQEQRIAYQAKIAALRAEANAIAKSLREEETTQKVEKLPAKEAETTQLSIEEVEEIVEIPKAEEVAEAAAVTPSEEETTEEVAETPVEKEVAEEATETPSEEEVAESVTETSEEEETSDEEETSEEEKVTYQITEVPEKDPEDNAQNDADSDEEDDNDTFSIVSLFKKFVPVIGIVALVGIFIMLVLMYNANNKIQDPSGSNPGVVDTTDPNGTPNTDVPGTDVPTTPIVSQFDMDTFVTSVTKIAKEYTNDENIGVNADICCNNIGEKELKELIETYDELTVQKGIATILAFGAEAKMKQYIVNNGLDYNPNAVIDYSNELQKLDDAYKSAKGKNPDGALMSLDGYDAFNGNRDALREMITKSGDMDLLTWYNAKMNIYDTMRTQTKDTNAALAYKKTVETEILKSAGFAKLLKLQLEQEAAGTLSVVDNTSMSYTEDYYNFILNNYIYIVAG